MKKISLFLILFLITTCLYAAQLRKTFTGTATTTAIELPLDDATVLTFQVEDVCIENLDDDQTLYVKPCLGAVCAANAADATCTDGTGCAQWIIPPARIYCFSVKGINKFGVDATGSAVYILSVSSE